jgi:hypothetical protein
MYDELYGWEEHAAFEYATDTDWDRAEAYELGEANPDRAWVCTDRDVWHPNPFYTGEPQPHPEEIEYEEY